MSIGGPLSGVLTVEGLPEVSAITRPLMPVSARPAPTSRAFILEIALSKRETVSPETGRSHNICRKRLPVGGRLFATTAVIVIPRPQGLGPRVGPSPIAVRPTAVFS